MGPFTVISDYFATGEGRTLSIWMGFAADRADATKRFVESVHGGDWYAIGAEVLDGFDFDNAVADAMVSPVARAQLMDESCNRSYSAQLHFNYS